MVRRYNKTLSQKRQDEREKLLKQVGYTRLVEKGLKSQRPNFPDLSTNSPYNLSNSIGNGFKPKPLPEDAIQFPVGQSHKQGPMLITKSDSLADMGGRKT